MQNIKSYSRHAGVWLVLFAIVALICAMPWSVAFAGGVLVLWTVLTFKVDGFTKNLRQSDQNLAVGIAVGATLMFWLLSMGVIAYLHPRAWGWYTLYLLLIPIVIVVVEFMAAIGKNMMTGEEETMLV